MNPTTPPNRCRIVLIAPPTVAPQQVEAALAGGDVASLILPGEGVDEASFQSFAEKVVAAAQKAGVAVVVAGDTRVAGRVHADGIHIEGNKEELAEAVESYQQRMMVGAGGAKRATMRLSSAKSDQTTSSSVASVTTTSPSRIRAISRSVNGGPR